MEIKLITNDLHLVEKITYRNIVSDFEAIEGCKVESENLRRIPGASGGLFELAVNFGLVAIPSSIFAGIIAAWIWSLVDKKNSAKNRKLKIVLRNEGRTAEIEVDRANKKDIKQMLEAALRHVDKSG